MWRPFCGQCFFCKHGWVNNCTDSHGGWALGCRIDGGQAEFVRVPYADQGLNKIPDGVSDRQALFVGDILANQGFWATRISKIHPEDTVLIIGAGAHRNLHIAVRAAPVSQADHRLRKRPSAPAVCAGALPPGADRGAGEGAGVCDGKTATTAGQTWSWRWLGRKTPSAWPGSAPGRMPWLPLWLCITVPRRCPYRICTART